KRADAYHLAGADAILMHSKNATPHEILAFMAEWKDTSPVVVVPTTYYNTPTSVLKEAGVNLVIWANHLMRSSITSMQQAAARIFEEQSLVAVEGEIAPLSEVFRLQGAAELITAESQYLPINGVKKQEPTTKAQLQHDRLNGSTSATNL
ncbi:MAG: isocitrate lyase/phosphoenolpyruvate mutase family protein, partial [Anaerolineae bacterium]|nr:isocitrate lyase/phosphoenolpyruvate mutase family protein [Anaerolineae bacterium]